METGTEENRQKPMWSEEDHIWEAAEVWILSSRCPLSTLLGERAPWAPRSFSTEYDPNTLIYSF